jgi:DNA-binding transcriptional LysR family regulator
MANPLVVIAPPDHTLVKVHKKLTMTDLRDEKFVVREKGSGTREAIERHFRDFGFFCTSKLEMSSNEAIKHAVSAGFGLGIVSFHTIELELKTNQLVILEIKGFPLLRYWHLVTRKGKTMSPIAEAFRVFLLEKTKEIS